MASAPSTANTANSRHRKLSAPQGLRTCSRRRGRCGSGGARSGLGLAAQVADVDVEVLGVGAEVVAPDALVDVVGRARCRRCASAARAGRTRSWCSSISPLATQARRAAGSSTRSATRSSVALAPREAGAPQQGPQPRQQLVQRERLRQVVVGAGVEAGHPVGDLVARGEHRAPGSGRPRRRRSATADAEAVEPGHHHVEDEQVEAAAGRARARRRRRPRPRPRSRRTRARGERLADGSVVVRDDQMRCRHGPHPDRRPVRRR